MTSESSCRAEPLARPPPSLTPRCRDCDPDVVDAPTKAFRRRGLSGEEETVLMGSVNWGSRGDVGPTLDSVKHTCDVYYNKTWRQEPWLYASREWIQSPWARHWAGRHRNKWRGHLPWAGAGEGVCVGGVHAQLTAPSPTHISSFGGSQKTGASADGPFYP